MEIQLAFIVYHMIFISCIKTKYFCKRRIWFKAIQTFYEITGRYSNLVRLPYGSKPYASKESYNNLVNAGYKIWDWNIDTQDWKSSSSEIVENAKTYSKNKNEIVLLIHEKKQTVEALDSLINYLIEEGYDILPINENQDPKNFWLKNLYK